jgi:hypothetical protein
MIVLLHILAPLVLSLPFTLADAWEAVTSARLAARVNAMRAAGEPVFLGLGNIVGPGERFVRYWSEVGSPHER